jgi:hypothetical protein
MRAISLASLCTAAVLCGCATESLHQPAVQVLFTTPETIKLRWHSLRFTESEAQAMVIAYCKGKSVTVIDAGPPDEYRTKTWRCG